MDESIGINDIEKLMELANNGHEEAQFNLGLMYKEGNRVEVNYEEAIKWIEKSANQGYAPAQYELGYMYIIRYGLGFEDICVIGYERLSREKVYRIDNDYKKATKFIKKAANQGNFDAKYYLEDMLNKNGYSCRDYKYEEVINLITERANQNLADAQDFLGLMVFKQGYKAKIDNEELLNLLTTVANQGQASAQYQLGVIYQEGFGLNKDYKEAIYWYEKAANQGHIKAQFNLGTIYDNGLDRWEYDNEFGWQDYYSFKLEGFGGEKDNKKAIHWYEKAAKQGDIEAYFNLEHMLFRYLYGVEQDNKETVIDMQNMLSKVIQRLKLGLIEH